MMQAWFISFSWQDLWFLRPVWFWGFIPVGAIALMLLVSFRRKEEWKKSFSRSLLPFIIKAGTRAQFLWPRVLLVFILSLMLIGLAGPTWEERDNPGMRSEAALVVLMDISRSMLAEDIQPNRLERSKLKMRDLFNARPGVSTALVAYAGSAHLLVPFTKDYSVISYQMEALHPSIMPLMGSNLDDALDLADSLLIHVEARSTILLLTDRITEKDVNRIRESSRLSHVEIMILGTPGGATIPSGRGVLRDQSGEVVVVGFDPALLGELGVNPGVNIVPVTLDGTDVKILAMHISENLEYISDPEKAETEWKDAGYWMLIPLVLLTLFWFRRAWMVYWILLLFLLPGCINSDKIRMSDIFRTRDQQGAKLLEQGAPGEAAERFESLSWKGYAYAENGQLDQAIEAFSGETNADGFYNLGVLYARTGDVDAAREAFNAALELDPGMEAARNNLERVDQVLDSLFLVGERESGAPEDEQPDPGKFEDPGKLAENQEQAQESDQKYKGQGDVRDTGSRELDESSINFFDSGGEPAPFDPRSASQSLLRQVEEDPSLFLRRKFAHQLRNRKDKPEAGEESW